MEAVRLGTGGVSLGRRVGYPPDILHLGFVEVVDPRGLRGPVGCMVLRGPSLYSSPFLLQSRVYVSGVLVVASLVSTFAGGSHRW